MSFQRYLFASKDNADSDLRRSATGMGPDKNMLHEPGEEVWYSSVTRGEKVHAVPPDVL
jgi:hypothetical protein